MQIEEIPENLRKSLPENEGESLATGKLLNFLLAMDLNSISMWGLYIYKWIVM